MDALLQPSACPQPVPPWCPLTVCPQRPQGGPRPPVSAARLPCAARDTAEPVKITPACACVVCSRAPAGDNPSRGSSRLGRKSSRPLPATPKCPTPCPWPTSPLCSGEVPGEPGSHPGGESQRSAAVTAFRSRCKSIAAPWQLYFHAPMLFFHSIMGRMTLFSFSSFGSFSSFLSFFLSFSGRRMGSERIFISTVPAH